MNSSTKLWAIGWLCVVALFTSSTGMVWPLVFGACIVAIAMAPPVKEDDE